MNLKLLSLAGVVLLSACFIGNALAMEPGNKRKGKYTYRKVYKTCHQRGGVDSPKPVFNPDAKTQAQWESLFDNRQFDEFGCQEEWSQLNKQGLNDIFTYLHAHAADSPTPLKCKP